MEGWESCVKDACGKFERVVDWVKVVAREVWIGQDG